MKIRNGFVSNSSSSSFCIYGVEAERNDLEKMILKEIDEETFEEKYEGSIGEYFWHNGEKIGNLEIHNMYNEYYYIGRSWHKIGENETGKEFKESVEKSIKELYKQDKECSTIQEAWREG